MAKLETALNLEQVLEGMRQLSDREKRALASIVLSDPGLQAFVEELDDNLTCERAVNERTAERFSPDELTVFTQPAGASPPSSPRAYRS